MHAFTDRGSVLSQDAEREWFRKERERVTLQLMRQAAAEAQEVRASLACECQMSTPSAATNPFFLCFTVHFVPVAALHGCPCPLPCWLQLPPLQPWSDLLMHYVDITVCVGV